MASKQLLIAILAAAIMAALYFFSSSSSEDILGASPAHKLSSPEMLIDLACLAKAEPCEQAFNQNKVSARLTPADLPALTPLVLEIKFEQPVSELVGRFEGRDMEMGVHFLEPFDVSADGRQFKLKGMIPVCTVDQRMVWTLSIDFKQGERLLGLRSELQPKH